MLEKLRVIFIYNGIDRISYERAKPKITRMNRFIIEAFSGIAAALLSIFFIMTFFIVTIENNRVIYGLGASCAIILFIFARFIAKKYHKVVRALVHLAVFIFYTYGIIIGTIISPDRQSVTFMVLLVFLPMLFIDRPAFSILFTTVFVLTFQIICLRTKAGDVLSTDIVNVITFSLLGVVSGIASNYIKIRGYVNENKLHEISRLDQLTQMNNRNAYELEYDTIPSKAKRLLACVYIDVNGLHVVNNTKGHSFGDEMLKFVSEQIVQYFGNDLTYRIGGDEFIAFVPEPNEWEITQKIREIRKNVEERNYHIAVGISFDSPNRIDMDDFVRQAEVAMYHDKDNYYESIDQLESHNKSRNK